MNIPFQPSWCHVRRHTSGVQPANHWSSWFQLAEIRLTVCANLREQERVRAWTFSGKITRRRIHPAPGAPRPNHPVAHHSWSHRP